MGKMEKMVTVAYNFQFCKLYQKYIFYSTDGGWQTEFLVD